MYVRIRVTIKRIITLVLSEKHNSAFIEKMPPYGLYLMTIDICIDICISFVQIDPCALNTLIVTNRIYIFLGIMNIWIKMSGDASEC